MLGDSGLPENIQAVLCGEPLVQVFPVSPDDIGEISRAGAQFSQQGLWEKARNVFSALVALAPDNYTGYAGLGSLLLQQRKVKEAFPPLLKAATLNSNDPNVCTNLGEVLLRVNKLEEAKVLLKSVADMDPEKRHPACNRARALLEAIEDLDRDRKEAPKAQ
jgi:Flp pilus assembly protein TadD